MLQLVYNVHTCDHAHVHIFITRYGIHLQLIFNYDQMEYIKFQLWNTFSINIPIDTIGMAISVPLLKYY
jgi:hypothetical protein